MSNQQNSHQMWWTREKRDHLPARILAIQRTNDPTTYADEVLSICRTAMPILLVATGLLGAMSYYKFFFISFPFEVSIFLAMVLTAIIEVGKLKGTMWALRIPMFHGMRYIGHSPANTFIWAGLIVLSAITFTMSIKNSTKGGEQLAMMMASEKNETKFTTDTKQIDEQIALLQQANQHAPTVKWKGKTYYQDAKSVRANSNAIESLQRQREESIKMQRADWEKSTAIKEGQTNWGARLVLASGGWLEAIELILILLAVACEKVLDGRALQSSATNFNQQQTDQSTLSTAGAAGKIGFKVNDDGNVRSADAVTQPTGTVSQIENLAKTLGPDQVLRWFETELRREPSNLQNKHANKSTVIQRIHTKLSQSEEFIKVVSPGDIPRQSADRFEKFLTNELFPVIQDYNPQYTGDIIKVLKEKSA